ncbi:MAG: GNAT family N-acetyltransferase [Pseudomonadota bacterium]
MRRTVSGLVTIRPADPTETEALIAIWRDAARRAHPFLPGEGRGARAHTARTALFPKAETAVAEADGQALGFLSLIDRTPERAEIAKLYIRPSDQGRGLGRQLVAWAAGRADTLSCKVYLRNATGLGFWQHLGFSETGRAIDGTTAEVVAILERQG